ncbi:unnamed protein product [Diabrotica balteata]|uniref:Uncharacterized protein n=1 Tax=Diabrotica balteata TaxID=107213 RepID=A0A9P0GZ47_DIABA|nr:unnamed protein product [Diabrotica balteata]
MKIYLKLNKNKQCRLPRGGAAIFAIMCCDLAAREAKNLTTVCYNLLNESMTNQKNAECTQMLLQLIDYTKSVPAKFTAADFYEIKRTTILQILGIAMTYFVVVVQFDGLS